jgi:Mor family transcriptional regulator
MSYIRADEILPRELLEAIQQYVDGQIIYIPRKEKQAWGSGTSTKEFFRERNERIFQAWQEGISEEELSRRFSLSRKSIQRILRNKKLAIAAGDDTI